MSLPHHPTIEPFAIEHATLATGDEDGRSIPDSTVVVDEVGRIEAIGPSASVTVPNGYHRLEATGKVVSPGMINGHIHTNSKGLPGNPKNQTPTGQRRLVRLLRSLPGQVFMYFNSKSNIETMLNSGVTTVRSVGDIGYELTWLRDEIRDGIVVGPRIIPAGPMMSIPDGHGAPLSALESATPEESRHTTAVNIAHGVRAIKIAATGGVTDSQVPGEAGTPQMSIEQMRAICETAHEVGIIVAAHAQSRQGVYNALKAGVDTIEHGCPLDDELIGMFLNNPLTLRGYSALEPTLSAGLPTAFLTKETLHMTEIQLDNSIPIAKGVVVGARDAHEAGIKVGVGTDTGVPYSMAYGTWREMDLLHRYSGFSTAEAFHAGTQVTAEIIGVSDITGSLEVGKSADLLVLAENPVDNLRTLEHPLMVVAAGHPIFKPSVKRYPEIESTLDMIYSKPL
ncbi:amidohydrolase family protein [Bifidobacterium sp. ESL0690]|uniref:amidohydrolase family protein n=1 Tax=Bifidobacterium sp. ESL0690 TaxID=2983214 RepID=UPI0023F65F68|nr:amidohydrolase family protein [Bifidobacterium sp. ESL0690]WEV45993.1 amidohydrolase family protein [Bifidobacterium sp. ESL0690]